MLYINLCALNSLLNVACTPSNECSTIITCIYTYFKFKEKMFCFKYCMKIKTNIFFDHVQIRLFILPERQGLRMVNVRLLKATYCFEQLDK